MIPFIRSHSELMAITESRDVQRGQSLDNRVNSSTINSDQRKRNLRSLDKKRVTLPNLPKTIISRWLQNKTSISKFVNNLDYNNQIQSSYDLTLLQRLNETNQQDAA